MSALKGYSIFCCLIVCCIFTPDYSVNGELFTSTAEMEKLLDVERALVSSLDIYLISEEIRLEHIRDLRQKLSHIESIASQDVRTYLANPVNAFVLIKAVTSDWTNGN